jgi:hypothetical protein
MYSNGRREIPAQRMKEIDSALGVREDTRREKSVGCFK